MSYPGWSRTLKPCMRLKRVTVSFSILFQAVPTWIEPVVYGGPSRK